MKTITMIWVGCLLAFGLVAEEPLGVSQLTAKLRTTPSAELPAVAGVLVKESKDPSTTIINVVRISVGINPGATAAIVGAVARAAPESAPLTARVAAGEQPGQAAAIARAAAGVAPPRAGDIVTAVCSVVPGEYRRIALAAARAAPGASREILRAVGSSRADLKPYLDREIELCRRGALSVAQCLDRAELARARAAASVAARDSGGVAQGNGPPSPLIPPGQIGPKPPHEGGPPGGRNYARP